MERLTEILQKLNARYGAELGSKNETEEERIERSRKAYEYLCEQENARQGDLNNFDGYDCKICLNKGYTVVPELYLGFYQQKQVSCKCNKARNTIRALNRSGLADVVHNYTFEKYIATENWQKSVLTTAKQYLDDCENHCFFFGGQTGSGKTHICTAVAIALLKRDKEVKYMLWRDEVTKLKAKVNEPDYEVEINRYKTVDVLYIDDLFKTGKTEMQKAQRPTQADINLAFEIINSRVMQKKITIISSESTLTDIIDIDESVAGRIKQSCGEYCINIAPDRNKNYRLRG